MRLIRGFLVVAVALLLVGGVFIFFAGDERFALAALLWGAGALVLATWAWGYPTAFPAREWIGLGLVAAGFAVLGLVLVAIFGLLALFLLSVLSGRFTMRRLSGVELEVVGPEVVMPGAENQVAEFEAAGFRPVGGYQARLPLPLRRKVVTTNVLAGPDGDRFAVANDRVWEVLSRFGDRWLLTTSSGLSPLPATVLRQTVAGGRPAELVRAHQTAVELIAPRPDRFDEDAAVVDAALAHEHEGIRFVAAAPTKSALGAETRRASDNPVLGRDDLSRRRIDAWLHTPEPS